MKLLKEFLQTVLLALLIFFLLQTSVQSVTVLYGSMEPSLHEGQRLLMNKAVYFRPNGRYLFHPPQRGEVVVFRLPPNAPYVKRIIGLPGEVIEIKGGRVYINGQPLVEPYIKEAPRKELPSTPIPQGHYFVLGDNRNVSLDSRALGPIPGDKIIGKAWFSYWPPEAWGRAPNHSFLQP